MSNRITVSTTNCHYPIIIDDSLLNHCPQLITTIGNNTPYIISNDIVAPLYLRSLSLLLARPVNHYLLADGEKNKSFQQFELIISDMLRLGLGRDTTIIALGGGVVGDLAGFVAACYQRGIPFIQIPTTLLAQVDASVGGKTAINHSLGKNMVGSFHQPSLVIIDTQTLETLPDREYRAGLSEVIKYGLIMDANFFNWLTQNVESILAKDKTHLNFLITRCCELKAQIVEQDEKELGIRAILNLGHTFAHAIEAETGYCQYLHGEAVAIGLHAAMRLSVKLKLISDHYLEQLIDLLHRFNLPILIPKQLKASALLLHMKRDKKNLNGQIRIVLNIALGQARVEIINDDELIMAALPYG